MNLVVYQMALLPKRARYAAMVRIEAVLGMLSITLLSERIIVVKIVVISSSWKISLLMSGMLKLIVMVMSSSLIERMPILLI